MIIPFPQTCLVQDHVDNFVYILPYFFNLCRLPSYQCLVALLYYILQSVARLQSQKIVRHLIRDSQASLELVQCQRRYDIRMS